MKNEALCSCQANVLIIGAGAVGQVYGYYLSQGGAEVSFFVREKYVTDLAKDCLLHELRLLRRPLTRRWNKYEALCQVKEVAAQSWDQVWLAVPSTALRRDDIYEVLAATGQALIVMLQPDLQDRAQLTEHLPKRVVVQGMINMISFQSPLPGSTQPDGGIAYLVPPGYQPLTGEQAPEVVRLLRAGRMRARVVPNVAVQAAFGSAVGINLVAVLELADWRFKKLKGALMKLGCEAACEAVAVVKFELGIGSQADKLARPWLMRLLLKGGDILLPFDFEAYLHHHFAKVGAQTRLMMDTWLVLAQKHGSKAKALAELRAALSARRESEM